MKRSSSVQKKVAARQTERSLEPNINSQFDTGRLLACLSSRPGQCGRADGCAAPPTPSPPPPRQQHHHHRHRQHRQHHQPRAARRYILEGKELEFYVKRMARKKK